MACAGRYVFTTGWGEPIYPDTVTSLMTKLIRAAGSYVVAARLGHADPAITLRVYAHVIRSAEAAAANIFADAVNEAC